MLFSELDLNKTYSYADYYSWDFQERAELINGKIHAMSPTPNMLHQEICGNIYTPLKNILKDKNCKVFFAPFDVRLPRKVVDDKSIFTVLQPDVCVICDINKLDKRGCIGAPDIVVEVLSKGNNSKELKNKYDVYKEAGVKVYWIVSPQNQTVTIYTLVDYKFQLSRMMVPGDIVTSSVLPDFTLDLSEVFIGIEDDD